MICFTFGITKNNVFLIATRTVLKKWHFQRLMMDLISNPQNIALGYITMNRVES